MDWTWCPPAAVRRYQKVRVVNGDDVLLMIGPNDLQTRADSHFVHENELDYTAQRKLNARVEHVLSNM